MDKDVLSRAGSLHHTTYVVQPERYLIYRLLQMSGLHIKGRAGWRRRGVKKGKEQADAV